MSNPIRNGKIARLPKAIREEINHRLEKGATAKSLVGWLNGLPEVQAVVQAEFDGHPIREQNLSQWKNGGYLDWLRHLEALAVAEYLYERGGDLKAQGTGRMPTSEALSLWLTSRYIVATKEIEALQGEAAWRKQRQMCDDLMKMRRAEHQTERLQLDRERLELRRGEIQFKRECAERKRADQRPAKARPTNESQNRAEDEPGAPQPDRPWQDWSEEERMAWACRSENLERIHALTPAQKAERIRQFWGIPKEEFRHPDYNPQAA